MDSNELDRQEYPAGISNDIDSNDGSNQFKLPHLRKDALTRQGQLPLSLPLSEELKQKIEAINPPVVAAISPEDEEEVDVIAQAV